MAFSSDGALLVSASRDGTVRVWEVRTGTEVQRLLIDAATVGFAADNRSVVVIGQLSFTFPCIACGSLDELVDRATANAGRDLSPEERVRYLHEEPA